jgi:hypothetical protein
MVRTVQAPIRFNGEVRTPEIEVFMRSSSLLPKLRNQLVQDALEWGANYLLWADADHTFPEEALLRLLMLNLRVVGVNYPRRTSPTYPSAFALDGKLIWTTEENAQAGEITPVSSLGLGFCLMDMTIFNDLEKQAGREGEENMWPLFAYQIEPGQIEGIGEDKYFFDLLKRANVPVHLDHALSWSIGHFYPRLLRNSDTVSDKAAFVEQHGPEMESGGLGPEFKL